MEEGKGNRYAQGVLEDPWTGEWATFTLTKREAEKIENRRTPLKLHLLGGKGKTRTKVVGESRQGKGLGSRYSNGEKTWKAAEPRKKERCPRKDNRGVIPKEGMMEGEWAHHPCCAILCTCQHPQLHPWPD